MYQIQLTAHGFVMDYVNGETRELVVDRLRSRFPSALLTRKFVDSDRFWLMQVGHTEYELWIYELDKNGKPILLSK